jgi:cardiolipin synthase
MDKYQYADKTELVHSGKNYFELIERIIARSRETLHLQTYIFESDETGLKVCESLKKAAERGVKVFVMADAFGSLAFSYHVLKELRAAGVQFRFFSPLFSRENLYFGRRLHYKVIVADKRVALTGGINIANKYNSLSEHPWLDYAVYIEGEVCGYLHFFCEAMFMKKNFGSLPDWEKITEMPDHSLDHPKIRFRINDWLKWKNEIHKSYIEAVMHAQKSITIVASYFLPGKKFRKLLSSAAGRGVKISVILTGKSDVSSAKVAENYLYEFYLQNRISLYEWGNSVMHGKAMIIDGQWVTIGSFNLNFLSHYISIELNVDLKDATFASEFSRHLDEVISQGCIPVDLGKQEKKNYFVKIKRWLYYSFFRLLMNATVSKRKHVNR